jgi:dTMP kinase
MITRGKLIVLEGLDRSGKSTVSKYIQELLSHQSPTIAINFPDRTTPIGKMIH